MAQRCFFALIELWGGRVAGRGGAVIAALAGRRIDAPGTLPAHFPTAHIAVVRERLRDALTLAGATALVCAATCGADILALEVAGELELRRYVVLPFAPDVFRERSVTDRPGDWGPRFDAIVAAIAAAGDLTILDLPLAGTNPYERTNEGILTRALALAAGSGASAEGFAVWDGPLDHRTDYTRHFVRTAQWLGMHVTAIPIAG